MRSSSPIGCIRLPEMSLNRSIQGEVGPRNIKRSKSDTTLQNQICRSETSKFGRNQNQTVASENRTQLSEDRWKRSKSDEAAEIGRRCLRSDGSVKNQRKVPNRFC